jgi:hypothetical protein
MREVWSDKAIEFFKQGVVGKKLQAKIFKRNERDSSFYLALKTIGDNEEMLFTELMMSKGFCVFDGEFCEKDVVNTCELSFADYESGCLLEDNLEKRDSWLPSPLLATDPRKVTFNDIPRKNHKALTKSPEQKCLSESINFSSPLSTSTTIQQGESMKLARAELSVRMNRQRESPRLKLDEEVLSGVSSSTSYTPASSTNVQENFNREPLKRIKVLNTQKSSKSSGTLKAGNDQAKLTNKSQLKSNLKDQRASKTGDSALHQVISQNLNVFKTNETLSVYIHSIRESTKFFFFLESEFSDLAEFFRSFK